MAQAATASLTQNVLRDGLILPRTPDPAAMVIFGASGDLTARKLVPALYHLFAKGRLPHEFRVVGVSRSPWSDERFRGHLVPGAKEASGPA